MKILSAILIMFTLIACTSPAITPSRGICSDQLRECLDPDVLKTVSELMGPESYNNHTKMCYDELRSCLNEVP